ncbi:MULTISPECIES: 5-formyltetrahydrofolate cyclo-ligase [unclassified Geodermatophilus]
MSAPSDAEAAKSALRERVLAGRRHRTPAARAAAAAAVTTTLLARLARVRVLAAFVPEDTEPGSGRLPAAFTQLGARVLLPVVPDAGTELRWAVDTGRLAPGRFGILEPVGPRLGPTAVGTAEVVVVPALAVDRGGVRLGRGGGWYDRALVHVRPSAVVVALVFDDELVDRLPALGHDRPVSAVVTPSGGWQDLGSRTHR